MGAYKSRSLKRKKRIHKEKDQALAISARYEGQHQPPKIKVDVDPSGAITIMIEETELDAFHTLSGLLDPVTGANLVHQAVLSQASEDPEVIKENFDMAASLMFEMRPQDPFEGQLIAQMVATHNQAMGCFLHAERSELMGHKEIYLRFADRFLRTYTSQMEALSKHRRGGQQKVIVEHVHVHEGGQAIVGNVNQGGGGGNKK